MIQGILISLLAGTAQRAVAALTDDASPETKALAQGVSEVLGHVKGMTDSTSATTLGGLQQQIDEKMAAMNREADALADKLGDEPGSD